MNKQCVCGHKWEGPIQDEPCPACNRAAQDKFLNSISAIDALHAIDVELHMVAKYGPQVGQPYDQISAEHVYAAKMMIEALIKAQKA